MNNAGTNWGAPVDTYPEEGFRKVTALNTEAVFFLSQALLPAAHRAPAAPRTRRGSSTSGRSTAFACPAVDNFAYSASKAAVHHMTRVLAVKLGARHVTVNAVAPGPFESRMTEWLLDNMGDEIVARCPLGRIGAPADMAGIAIFLASRAAAYLTGTVIPVDGGLSIVNAG